MEEKQRIDKLYELVQDQKWEGFIEPTKANDLEALGLLVSKFCKWDGDNIVKVLCHALDDSNFHGRSEKINNVGKYSDILCQNCIGTFSVDVELKTKSCPYCGKDKLQEKDLIKIGGN